MKEPNKKLLDEYQHRKDVIKKRLRDFRKIPESEYFYELVYCLFTPQTKAENSFKVVEQMKSMNYFQKPFSLKNLLHQKDGTYIRFHNQKEKYVIIAYNKFPEILSIIKKKITPFVKREWLVKNIIGLSFKEASHFLRNIGKNGTLAILDRHILKNLYNYKIIKKIPNTITRKIYLEIEKKFQNFSNRINININELDLLFWSMETGKILK